MTDVQPTSPKLTWVKPLVDRVRSGDAEANPGTAGDGANQS